MALKLTWKPVLQPIELKEYHADFAGNVIEVCVNPQPTLWQERVDLQQEVARRYAESAKVISAGAGRERSADEVAEADAKAREYLDWQTNVFVPAINAWFAKLWSFGAEQFTAGDLAEYEQLDPHLLAWLKHRSIEMIEEHRSGIKKN